MDNIFLFQFEEEDSHQTPEKKQIEKEIISDKPYTFDSFNDDSSSEENEHDDKKQKTQQEVEQKIVKKQVLSNSTNKSFRRKRFKDAQQYSEFQHEKNEKENISNNEQKNTEKEVLPGIRIKQNEKCELQYIAEKKAIKVNNIKEFLQIPLNQYKIKAVIKKENQGIFNTNTKYTVFIEQNNRFLLTVLRTGLSNYILSLSKENISTKNRNYLGSMIGNISGTTYSVYDNGFNPSQTRSLQHCRKQIATIEYSQSKGPRKFQAIITTNSKGFFAIEEEQNILKEKWEKKERTHLKKLYSKMPQYDSLDGNYKLDFKGLVKEPSVKNFILMGEDSNESLVFGKTGPDTFIMEVRCPFSILQAVAICISSIQYKLHWT